MTTQETTSIEISVVSSLANSIRYLPLMKSSQFVRHSKLRCPNNDNNNNLLYLFSK